MIVPLTLGDFLERAEHVYGGREAVVDEPSPPGGGLGRFTYAQFGAMARSLAAALDDLGVGQNERVAIVSPNAARFLLALFGVSAFGRILVPVNFRLNAEEIRYILEHSGASALLVDPELDELLRHITVKHRVVLGDASDPQLFFRANARPRLAVAAAARRAKGAAIPGRGRVRVIVAGAPPPSKTIERVETELGWEFIQIYGLTETAPLLTINRAPAEWDGLDTGERSRRLSRAGVPAVGVRMRVDEEGELLARSNHVFEGYWNQPEETAKAIADGWFHTGDGGARDGAYIAITDRKKDVIISGGENVSSIEVEDCLFQHPAVAEVAVIGVPDEKWGETIKALVVLRPGTVCDERELIEHCRSRMAHYKCPTSIEIRDALVRTATGKLQKFKLREP